MSKPILASKMLWAALIPILCAPCLAAPGDLKLTIRHPAAVDKEFIGYSVSSVGGNILASALHGYSEPGRAFLFDGTTGSLLQTFANPDPQPYDAIGSTVAGYGDDFYFGTMRDNTDEKGAVYQFTTGSGLTRTFTESPGADGNWYGADVQVTAESVFVGSPRTNGYQGGVYQYNRTTGDLTHQFAPPGSHSGEMGYSISIDDNYMLVGSPDYDFWTVGGAAHLYDITTGSVIQSFINPLPWKFNGEFGQKVAMAGNRVLISAPSSRKVFLYDALTGALLRQISSAGNDLAVVGDDFLIGDISIEVDGFRAAGGAYLIDGETGDTLYTFLNPTPGDNDWFGYSVGALGNDLVISAPEDTDSIYREGAIYVYQGLDYPASSAAVPEPSTVVLLGIGGCCLPVWWSRRRRQPGLIRA